MKNKSKIKLENNSQTNLDKIYPYLKAINIIVIGTLAGLGCFFIFDPVFACLFSTLCGAWLYAHAINKNEE